jgi:hypothetical protein
LLQAVLSLGIAIAAASAAIAYQNNEIYACGQTCDTTCPGGVPSATCRIASSGKCVLKANVSCAAASSAIQLTSGTTLDMGGYDITCTESYPSSSCAYNAIEIVSNSGSTVTNSTGNESVISGPFTVGVECDNHVSTVSNITVNDGLVGIGDCKTVKNNVIGPTSQSAFGNNEGISSSGVTGNSFTNNFVTGRTVPIKYNASLNVTISHNLIDTTGMAYFAFDVGGGGAITASNNIVFGTGFNGSSTVFNVDTGSGSTLSGSGNYCDPSHPGCAACVSSNYCTAYSSPFAGN